MYALWVGSEIVYVYGFVVLLYFRLLVAVDCVPVAVLEVNDPTHVLSEGVVGKGPTNWKTLTVCFWDHPCHWTPRHW